MFAQAMLDRMAQIALTIQDARLEAVTYQHRTSRGVTPVTYPVSQAVFLPYSEHVLAQQALVPSDRVPVLRTDREIRIPTALVTWKPSTSDSILRSDGFVWAILAVNDGPGMPFYRFQGRIHRES